MHEHPASVTSFQLADTVQGCRDRLAALEDEIASIRIQIATIDIRRQADRKTLDPAWYHRAKTALRLKQQERTQVACQLAKLNANSAAARRQSFKDSLIEVLRDDCDDERWASALRRARALHSVGVDGGSHG